MGLPLFRHEDRTFPAQIFTIEIPKKQTETLRTNCTRNCNYSLPSRQRNRNSPSVGKTLIISAKRKCHDVSVVFFAFPPPFLNSLHVYVSKKSDKPVRNFDYIRYFSAILFCHVIGTSRISSRGKFVPENKKNKQQL